MKANMQNILAVMTLLLTLATVNCGGSSGSSSPAATTPGAVGTSCGTNMVWSQYNTCDSLCGQSMVLHNGSCIALTQNSAYGYGTTGYGTTGYGTTSGYSQSYVGNIAVCQQGCGPGYTMVGNQCAPQLNCGACYGSDGYNCYIGNYAHYYYGY